MEFDLAQRYSPHNSLSYPDYYYNDHNTPFALSFGVGARTNPRGYRIGESMVGSRSPLGVARDESAYDHGNSRRRIAVAVSFWSRDIRTRLLEGHWDASLKFSTPTRFHGMY
jgi:hypothetical protein